MTLHHFVHPRWFEALGGFEKEANISFFVQYTQTAFRWVNGVDAEHRKEKGAMGI